MPTEIETVVPNTEVKTENSGTETKVEDTTSTETKVEGTESSTTEKTEVQKVEDKKVEDANKTKHEDRFQKRINKLTAQKYALEAQLAAQNRNSNQVQQQQQLQKPDRSQFPDEASYIDALTDYKLDQRLPLVQQRAQDKIQSTSVEQAFLAKEAVTRKEIEDYDDAIEEASAIPVQKSVAEAILTSEYGPNLRYYLATHPDEAQNLNNMSSGAAARQIGKIESKIEADILAKKDVKTESPVKKVSSAPAPIRPVNSGGQVGELNLNDDKVPVGDWMKKRMEQKRNKILEARKSVRLPNPNHT